MFQSSLLFKENLLKTLTIEQQYRFRSEPPRYFLDFGLMFQGQLLVHLLGRPSEKGSNDEQLVFHLEGYKAHFILRDFCFITGL